MAKQSYMYLYGEKLSSLLDVKAFVGAFDPTLAHSTQGTI